MPAAATTSVMKWMKANAKFAYGGGALIGGLALASDIKGIADADNKLKALLKTAKDFIFIRVAFAGLFTAVGSAIKALVRDTGSLDAALKKLSQIQTYARSFAQFTGGLNSAKQRMVELHRLSLRQPFKFEELAEANKSLEIFTRGTYSSVQATQEIGKAAIASNNSIQDTARAVGMFYDQLRSGQPIKGAAEQLRQMGLISGDTADDLTALSESGADTTVVFGKLTKALGETGRGAEEYKDTIEGVTEAHDKAVQSLKESFGAPFTKGEIDNTKNMTKAMQAITPTMAKMSQGAAMLYGGFSTASSGILKFLASSKIVQKTLEGLGVAIGALTVVAGVFGTMVSVTLVRSLVQLSEVIGTAVGNAIVRLTGNLIVATYAATGLTVALQALSVVTVVGMVAGFVTALGGAIYHLYKLGKAAGQAFLEQRKGWAESTSEIGKQIAAVTTLAQKNEAVTKAIKAQIEAERALTAIKKKRADIEEFEKPAVPGAPGGVIEDPKLKKRLEDQQKAAEKNVEAKKKLVQEAMSLSGLDSEHLEALIKAEELTKAEREDREKSVSQRHQEVQAALQSARGAEVERSNMDAELIVKKETLKADRQNYQDRIKTAEERESEVRALKEAGKTEEAKALEERFKAVGEPMKQTVEQRQAAKEAFREREKGIAEDEAARIKVGLDVGAKQSSTYLQARLEQLQAAHRAQILQGRLPGLEQEPEKNKAEIARVKAERDNERRQAQGAIYDAGEEARTKARLEIAQKREAEAPALAEQQRQVNLQRFQIQTDIGRAQARARGDLKAQQAFEDLSKFTHHAEELMSSGFGKQEAISLAGEQTRSEIAEEYAGRQFPVSALTAIGGGGGLPGVDAQLEIARRQEVLQQKAVDYLAILAGDTGQGEQQAPTVFH